MKTKLKLDKNNDTLFCYKVNDKIIITIIEDYSLSNYVLDKEQCKQLIETLQNLSGNPVE